MTEKMDACNISTRIKVLTVMCVSVVIIGATIGCFAIFSDVFTGSGDGTQTDIDDCAVTVCQNGGTCLNLAGPGYVCQCAEFWTGDTCQDDIDDCTETVCQNGGTCLNLAGPGYVCQCADGWTGDTCLDVIDRCSPDPCYNGANCSYNATTSTCACANGFQGEQCQSDIDDCAVTPCQNGGTCLNLAGPGYVCRCAEFWTGDTCQDGIITVTMRTFVHRGVRSEFAIALNGEQLENGRSGPCQFRRGMHIIVVDTSTGGLVGTTCGDTFVDTTADQRLRAFLESVDIGRLVLFITHDDASNSLDADFRTYITNSYGSTEIGGLGFRDNWSMVAIKGGKTYFEDIEKYVAPNHPAPMIEVQVTMETGTSNVNAVRTI